MNKLIKSAAVIIGAIAILQATAYGAAGNASISVKIDKLSRLFVLNMNDAQGIKSFSFQPTGTDKLPYSGDLSGCPKNRVQDNVVFSAPADFTPFMKAVIADCSGGETEFEIYSPNENGVSKVVKIEKAAPPPPTPTPTPAPASAPAATSAAADPLATVTYPVKELGNCTDEKTCKTYCDNSANMERCVAFAKEQNLLPREDIAKGEKFVEIVKAGGGPGGCKSQQSCENYCNDVGKINECIAFAEKEGFMSEKELDEAKKIKSALDRGQKLPGDCKNKKACEAYCQSPERIDECFAFAKESGFMSEEELKQAEKFIPLMKAGKTPGGCKTKETCEAFCEDENNFDQCMAFADEAGLLSEQDKEMIKKTGGKGPGGCRGRACETFCDNPANQEVCFEFAKEHGLISEDDLRQMEEGKNQLGKALEEAPPEVKECIESILGPGGLEKMGTGFGGGREMGEKIKTCFEQSFSQSGGPGGGQQGGEFSGPGGCSSIDECTAYCKDHQDECQGFGPPGGGASSDQRPNSGGISGYPTQLDYTRRTQQVIPQLGELIKEKRKLGESINGDKEEERMFCEVFADAPDCSFAGDVNATMCKGCYPDTSKAPYDQYIEKYGEKPRYPRSEEYQWPVHYDMPGYIKLNAGQLQSQQSYRLYNQQKQSRDIEECVKRGGSLFGSDCVPGQQSQTQTATKYPGVCIVRPQVGYNSSPDFSASDLEGHYARMKKPNAYTLAELRTACTKADFEYLQQKLCAKNPQNELLYMVEIFNQAGGAIDSACSSEDAIGRGCTTHYVNCSQYQQPPSSQQQYQQSQPTTNFSGPGGCKTAEECTAYCTKNYQDPACKQFAPPPPSSSLPFSSLLGTVLGPWLLLIK